MVENGRLVTLIGDVVASKQHIDRDALQRSLRGVLKSVNERLRPVQPLEPTAGDEFQGAFVDVVTAVRASLLIRLELLMRKDGADSRYGLGCGEVTVFDPSRSPVSQDGPGWWSARASIDRAERLAGSSRTSFARTCFGYWPDDREMETSHEVALDAFLLCRDAIVEQMNERQRRLLLGLMLGRPQAELASDEGITQGAVSQSLQRSGAFAIEAAQSRLQEANA